MLQPKQSSDEHHTQHWEAAEVVHIEGFSISDPFNPAVFPPLESNIHLKTAFIAKIRPLICAKRFRCKQNKVDRSV
jgi:hypothetical protein